MKKFRTKLGDLIGSPEQDYVKVLYNGHVYHASEYDIRYIQVLISEHFLKRSDEVKLDEVDEFLKSIGITAIYNQAGNKMRFRGNGRPTEMFCCGFYDTAARLNLQLNRNERVKQVKSIKF